VLSLIYGNSQPRSIIFVVKHETVCVVHSLVSSLPTSYKRSILGETTGHSKLARHYHNKESLWAWSWKFTRPGHAGP